MSKRVDEALGAFDGRHVVPLRDLVVAGLSEEEVEGLLAALPGPDEVGATWMLKALDEAGELQGAARRRVFVGLGQLREGDALLHVLQMVQRDPGAAVPFQSDVEGLLEHKKALVRVWALDALARIDPGAARERVKRALDAREAAMRARARALLPLVGEE